MRTGILPSATMPPCDRGAYLFHQLLASHLPDTMTLPPVFPWPTAHKGYRIVQTRTAAETYLGAVEYMSGCRPVCPLLSPEEIVAEAVEGEPESDGKANCGSILLADRHT